MKTLKELKEWVLEDPDNRVEDFEQADDYLIRYHKRNGKIVIPKNHNFSRPVVESFCNDEMGYCDWLRKFRDDYLDDRSVAAKFVTNLSSDIQSRVINKRTTQVCQEALFWALRKNVIKDTPLDRNAYKIKIKKWSKLARKKALTAAKLEVPKGKFTKADERVVVDKFWEDLLQRVASGDLPEV